MNKKTLRFIIVVLLTISTYIAWKTELFLNLSETISAVPAFKQVVIKESFKVIDKDGTGVLASGVTSEMITSNFWTDLLESEALPAISYNRISKLNTEIIQSVPAVYDLSSYKSQLTRTELTEYINSYKAPNKTMYNSNGKAINQDFYNTIAENRNFSEIKDINKVRYGLTVKKTSIRSFPTDAAVYSSASDRTLDRFQETGCEPCEAVLILHESKDKIWYFVQVYNYRGWMKKDSIALAKTKKEVFNYVNTSKFLMVTGKKIKVDYENSKNNLSTEFNMGTKLFINKTIKDGGTISNYEVKLPVRMENGSLSFTTASVSSREDVHVGYLPYNKYNLITEAFKLQGIPYDWGDKASGRDCSSFLMYVFRTFGINLPRNTSEQEKSLGSSIKFNPQDNLNSRLKILDTLDSGSILYMPGHTMLYLGKVNGQHYMLHASPGFYQRVGNVNKYIPVNQVVVSPVDIKASDGSGYIMKFTSALRVN